MYSEKLTHFFIPDHRKDDNDPGFQTFKKQLFHHVLSAVFLCYDNSSSPCMP